ncbi:translation initiation factor [Candidatus Woesearchaeota archaeon]|jgi:translation initiation factor 1|nr:translation initiation factor [Candidatus Woesearchaeota archaeon]MBT4110362.1 translation initiation factor [Candidatus Woesearchaeota archaeon]MBT4336114.1 translation initiation factor [Candidatus Woesearchaeota archaeon]MBT4468907.1 translation initiation factor [Candidatus Woesearchaeota archaeon]MBT6744774.1 translation initiation factor [Candidatus Woesearchaeota archaeon]
MVGVCNQCGLPQDLCVCETIAREQQKIKVFIEKRKFGKKYTIITGVGKEANIDEILKTLKTKFACGGTAKNGQMELQGNHKLRIKQTLVDLGFAEETIEIA